METEAKTLEQVIENAPLFVAPTQEQFSARINGVERIAYNSVSSGKQSEFIILDVIRDKTNVEETVTCSIEVFERHELKPGDLVFITGERKVAGKTGFFNAGEAVLHKRSGFSANRITPSMVNYTTKDYLESAPNLVQSDMAAQLERDRAARRERLGLTKNVKIDPTVSVLEKEEGGAEAETKTDVADE